MNATWSDILQLLRQRLSDGVFNVWIEPLQAELCPLEPETDAGGWLLKLIAPNSFVASWVRNRLTPDLLQAATQALGQEPVLEILFDENVHSHANRQFDPLDNLPAAPALLGSATPLNLPVEMPKNPTRVQLKNSKYTFSDFVVGPCNQIAHAAAQNILQTVAPVDMLFLCSSSGLGKTHLTQAIGKVLSEEADKRHSRIEYLTAEEFTNQFVQASRFGNLSQFKEHFRNLDMLLLEDIHFLNGKDKTQEELLSTIKSLHARGGRVVLTSSFAPRDLAGLDAQLVSRFCSGFIASIEKPDLETRLSILKQKSLSQAINLPPQVTRLLAERITSDIRLLESCLHNLILQSRLLNCQINEQMAMDVIQNVSLNHPSLDLEQVIAMICRGFSLSKAQLSSKSRRQELVIARNTAYYLLRKHTSLTLEEIGQAFNRKHSTVIKGITQLENEISRQTPLGRQIQNTVHLIEKRAI